MLQDLTLFELLLYAVIWAMLGGLPGFYLASFINHNPRTGARIGLIAGLIVGFVVGAANISDSVEAMFNVVLLLWGLVFLAGLVLRQTNTFIGNHRETATLQQVTADLAYGLLLPTFVIVFTIVVFPMIWNVVLAFRPVRMGNLPTLSVFSLENVSLDNFNAIFRGSESFLDVFFPMLLDTVIFLVILAAGWFGGQLVARQMNQDRQSGAWWGILVAFVVVLLLAAQQEYSQAINDLLSGRRFLNVLFRTFIYTLTGTILAISMGLVAALLVKDKFPGRNIVRGFMLFPYIAPIVSVVFIWSLLLNAQFGLINEIIDEAGGRRIDFLSTPGTAFLMVILFQGWRYFPFAFLFILARIQAIPDDMYEAAKVDGAAPSQRLLYVTLPQLRAVFGTLFVLRFIWTFNKFDDVFLLTGGAANTQLVTIEIYDQLFSRSNIGNASAVALVLAAVLFVVVGIYFRWFMVEEQ